MGKVKKLMVNTRIIKITEQSSPSKQESWRMFNRIARRYDLLNRLLSLRQDVRWRKKLTEYLPDRENLFVLDLATGTADVLLSLFANSPRVSRGIGVDPAEEMLRIGQKKIQQQQLSDRIELRTGDAMQLPFPASTFDVVTIAFGIRNVPDVPAALSEMYRILKRGGRALVLEFSLPENKLLRTLYLFYFRHILPGVGGFISGDAFAYKYLNRTVETFPYGEDFCEILRAQKFENVRYAPLTFGIATIYRGDKV